MKILDLHCHLLPALDDGARDLPEALAMARGLWEAGIQEVIVTPHFEEGLYHNFRDQVLSACEELQKELDQAGIELSLYPGSEIMLTPGVPDLLDKGQLATLKDEGKYILVEFPLSALPLYIEDVLYEIKIRGLQPIIAHPERYRQLPQEILADNLIQMNLGSFLGQYGSRVRDKAERIEKDRKGQGLFYGTDAHRLQKEIWSGPGLARLAKNIL